MFAVFLLLEPVSVAANRFHQAGIVPGGLNLITQTLDVGVDGLGFRQVFPTPGVAQQIFARTTLPAFFMRLASNSTRAV